MREHKIMHATDNEPIAVDPAPLVLGAICFAPLAVAGACLLFLT